MENQISKLYQFCWSLLLLSLLLISNTVLAKDLTTQQQQFLAAHNAIVMGRHTDFLRISKQLQRYPLYPYLIYSDLEQRLSSAEPKEINSFLTTYADTPLANILRKEWLIMLASKKRWSEVLANMPAVHGVQLDCIQRRAQLELGQKKAAFNNITAIWLTGHEQPINCDPVFSAWRSTGGLTDTLVWQRMKMAIDQNDTEVFAGLINMLPPAQRNASIIWRKVYLQPEILYQPTTLNMAAPYVQDICVTGMSRLAKKNAQEAFNFWPKLQQQFKFTATQKAQVEQVIALNLAMMADSRSLDILNQLPASVIDDSVREWRVRAALQIQDWSAVATALNGLSALQQDQPIWRYWQARTWEMLGQTNLAQQRYTELSKLSNYYGFLASEHIGADYFLPKPSLRISQADLDQLAQQPAAQRARELYTLRWTEASRREWQWLTAHISADHINTAATLANQWGWYDRAIITSAKTNYADDLSLHFPLAYRAGVLAAAKQYQLNPAWIFAVIRQESIFIPDARSGSGALGLMQVMPETAKLIALNLGFGKASNLRLFDAATNINLGSRYLRQLAENFRGDIILATASYNAGPGRVQRWLNQRQDLPADIWIETIPWKETRTYVKNVLAYTIIYENHLNMRPTPERPLLALLEAR